MGASGRELHSSADKGEIRRFSASEVLQMVNAGIVSEDEPLELINGRLVHVVPQGPEHSTLTTRLRGLLLAAYRDQAVIVREEKPLAVDEYSLPEPDLAVVRGVTADYAAAHPAASDVVLAVEVAVTSGDRDRGEKLPTYATSGIAQVWIVDAPARRVEVYTEPQTDGRYRCVRLLAPGDDIELPSAEASVAVRSVFAVKNSATGH